MKRVLITSIQIIVAVLLLCPIPLQSQTGGDTVNADIEIIRQISVAIDSAFSACDGTAMAALVTEDAIWMPPEEPSIKGRAAIEKRYTDMFGEFISQFKDITHSLVVEEVQVCGDWAISRGHYQLKMTLLSVSQTIVITGKNVHTYKRQEDGRWLIASDIWNYDAPIRRGQKQ